MFGRLFRVGVLCALGSNLYAQVDRATLAGTVTDSSGAVVPGASVGLLLEETGFRREAQSAGNGTFSFPGLPIGTYTISISHPGFRTAVTKELRLTVGDNRTLNVELQ